MIKRVKEMSSTALIGEENFRNYVENFESEILRGISTLTILAVIHEQGEEGSYGYQILKALEEKSGSVLVIEEGTLYPILRKLKGKGIVTSEKKQFKGRMRTYYKLTDDGFKALNHMLGFFTKLVESISPFMEIDVSLQDDRYVYCPNCMNKIDILDETVNFCDICGLNVKELKIRGKENE